MGNVRIGRVNEELLRVLSELLRTVRDPRVSGGMVSITHVEAAPDLGSAKVYISILGDSAAARDCIKGLRAASGYLRREAAKKLRLRHTPELIFIEDDSIVAGTRIMELIGNVTRDEEKKRTLNAKSAAEFLKTRDDILILTHKSPDGDAAGSAAALASALCSSGKRAYVFENPEFTEKLKKITRRLYPPEGFKPRCIVAVDCADIKLLSSGAEEFCDLIELEIDHHVSHMQYAQLSFVDGEAAACGELVFDIIKELEVKLTKKTAEALYIAIATDTGRFLHSNTTPKTHMIAAELLKCGVDFAEINRDFFVKKSRARISVEAELLSNINICFDGRVGIIKLPMALVEKAGACEDDLDGLSALARVTDGVELGIYLREKSDGIKISARSGDSVDAAEFCAHFGGGGHTRAAGCSLSCSLSEAEEKVIELISKLSLFK